MTAQNIYEVRQRTPDNMMSRELGFFTDDSMAKQTIDWCYREVYKKAMQKDFVPDAYISQDVRNEISLKGYNVWMVDNLNGGLPLFYSVQHLMFNQVPIIGGDFVMTVSSSPFDIYPSTPILP